MDSKKAFRIIPEHIAITITILMAVAILLFSFLHHPTETADLSVRTNHIIQRIFAVVLLFTALNLHKNKRIAWVVIVVVLLGNIGLHLTHPNHLVMTIFLIIEVALLFFFVFILKPMIFPRKATAAELEHARKLLYLYGQNPESYLTLEDDKTLYFGKNVEGVIAYGIVGSTFVVLGDPVCADEDFIKLLDEFTTYAEKTAHHLFYLSITDRYLEAYKNRGYGLIKCGEESRFLLSEYNIEGKKGAKIRANVNHATKAGLTVKEYKVLEQRDRKRDAEFDRITKEWLAGKKSGELAFSVGGVGLDCPRDKRYFYAEDQDGKMQGFVVFVPFGEKGNGYMADVTRRGHDAPSGINELIIYDAFQVFKEEGRKWGSMGLAPLARLSEEDGNPMMEHVLTFIYEHLNGVYGFKDLYRAKEKYSPTSWEPGYFAYLPKIPTPQMLYAVVRIQNPKGILDYLKALFHVQRAE